MNSKICFLILIMVFIGCEKKEPVQQKEHKSKEEIFLKMQEEDKKFHQTISERKVKYKDMLSVNRGSGILVVFGI